jgi:hypothetical protein
VTKKKDIVCEEANNKTCTIEKRQEIDVVGKEIGTNKRALMLDKLNLSPK